MDLFADDDLHPAFQRLGLLPLLKEGLPTVGGWMRCCNEYV